MKKRIVLLVFMFIMLFSLNSQSTKMAIKDFFIIYKGEEIRLGESLNNFDSECTTKKFQLVKTKNNEYKVYDYSWGQIYTFAKSKNYTICGFVINTDEVCIIDNIRIGSDKKTVIEKRGVTLYQNDNSFFYYNDDYDVLELKISFNNDDLVSKIQLFMGT